MAWTVVKRIKLVYLLVIAILIINVIISWLNVRTLVSNEGWVNHTREALGAIERTRSIVKDAEIGQRGYLLTGDGNYLDSYRGSTEAIAYSVDELQALTSDNPAQQSRCAHLRRLI